MTSKLRFGAFIPPLHPIREHPTLALERDMALVQHMDRLAYDEAWIGEHHSSGAEIIGSPEVFIAAVAERTRNIRLGSGVSSLTYHHPFIIADRFVQLDHQTRGRVMMGAGPGQLPSDAYMMGVDPADQRRMMVESLESIVELFEGGTVTRETDWFKLREARLQMRPYGGSRMEMAVAAVMTPSGPALAGRLGLGMLSLAASTAAGFNVLPEHWKVFEAEALKAGRRADRSGWRIVAPMHIAPTRQQALDEVREGAFELVKYFHAQTGSVLGFDKIASADEALDIWTTKGLATTGVLMAGTPDDAIAYLERMQDQTGGFGAFLFMEHNAASPEATLRSHELFARQVIPHFQQLNVDRQYSVDWMGANAETFIGSVYKSQKETIKDFESRGTKTNLSSFDDAGEKAQTSAA